MLTIFCNSSKFSLQNVSTSQLQLMWCWSQFFINILFALITIQYAQYFYKIMCSHCWNVKFNCTQILQSEFLLSFVTIHLHYIYLHQDFLSVKFVTSIIAFITYRYLTKSLYTYSPNTDFKNFSIHVRVNCINIIPALCMIHLRM